MAFLDRYTKNEIEKIVKESHSRREVLLKLGVAAEGGVNSTLLSQYIKDNNIDISHFKNRKLTASDIFIQNSMVTQSSLKRAYESGGYSEYKCAICGMEPMWNGEKLVLTLDHIDGVNNNNELNNLRWICPNCDSQLETFGSKRFNQYKEQKFCKHCGREVSRKNVSGFCRYCVRLNAAHGDNK